MHIHTHTHIGYGYIYIYRSVDSICDGVNGALVEKVTAEAKRAARICQKSAFSLDN
jgi:hypothetical protein